MRIVYMNPGGKLGGAETSLRELLASIRIAEPDWQLWLVLGEDGPLANIARDLGVRVVIRPFPPALARIGDAGRGRLRVLLAVLPVAWGAFRYAWGLARFLRETQPDLIHTNGFKMHLLGAWAGPRRVPLVWHVHDYVSTRPLMKHVLRRCYKACRVAIANSNSTADDLRVLLPHLRVVTVYNAIDLERFSPNGPRLNLDQAAGLPPAAPETVRVGLVATFARWKGHMVFLQAMARLSADAAVRGYVVGDAIYSTDGSQWSRQELEQEADRLGLHGRVGFTGFLPDTSSAMRSMDIVVHASTQPEPFGMVIIEGMACAKPVIASRAGGATELFVEGENALAHSPGDAAALANKIELLVSDAALRRRLGQAAKAAVERIYHGKRLAKQVVTIYRECVWETGAGEKPAAIESSLRSGERVNSV